MNSPRFYCPVPLRVGDCVVLPEAAARHAVRVLRLKVGAALTLFDGSGGEYAASIALVERDSVSAEVLAWREAECESPLAITLAQALQAGEKMDMTVQKAVELGVVRIVPLVSRRSVVRLEGERAERRVAHWQGVAASACEQCGRNRVPGVAPIAPIDHWLAQPAEGGVLRLMLAPDAEKTLDVLPRATRIELLVGAEGGLAPEEVSMAAVAGFVPIRLGPRILRTETAGLAALAAIHARWGDFVAGNGGENKNV